MSSNVMDDLLLYCGSLNPLKFSKPSNYMEFYWEKFEEYKKNYRKKNNESLNNSLSGSFFEKLFRELLIKKKINIYLENQTMSEVKFVKPDFLLKTVDNNYLFLSLKTSLRERWKQADWEGLYFKKKYTQTQCFLITINKVEHDNLLKKVDYIDGIDDVFYVFDERFNDLIDKLTKYEYQ
jgi:hypothetical protein